jgi:DNA polymerase-3 subunit gamma/tau
MLGSVTRDHVERIARALAAGEAAAALEVARELDEFAPDYGQLLDELAALFERVALLQCVPGYAGDEYTSMPLVRELAAAISAEDVQLYYQTAILGRRDLALAPDARTGFRMTLIRMLVFRPDAAGQQAVPAARAAPAAAPSPAAATPGSAAGAPSPTGDWATLLASLDLDGPTRMLALNCALLAQEPGLLRLRLDARNAGAHTRAREEKLAQALARHFGASVRVEIGVGEVAAETPAQAGERAGQEVLAGARAAFGADPTVRALQERFGATINPDSVRPRRPDHQA